MSNLKRVIVDYKKLTPGVLQLLVEKYPDGYGDRDIIKFKNIRGEAIEAVEVTTSDTIFLVKIGSKLQHTMANFDDTDTALLGMDKMQEPPFESSEEE